jgi:hypothetical protein
VVDVDQAGGADRGQVLEVVDGEEGLAVPRAAGLLVPVPLGLLGHHRVRADPGGHLAVVDPALVGGNEVGA